MFMILAINIHYISQQIIEVSIFIDISIRNIYEGLQKRFTGIVLLVVCLITFQAKKERWQVVVANVLVPIAVVVATWSLIIGNAAMAKGKAKRIISACERYAKDHGRYPKKLDDLVPKYIRDIPVARFTIMFSGFEYSENESKHTLCWTVIPPFLRSFYELETKRWYHLD